MALVLIKVGSQLSVLLQFIVASSIGFFLYQLEKNPFLHLCIDKKHTQMHAGMQIFIHVLEI